MAGSTTTVSQTWRNEPRHGDRRTWQVNLQVTGVDLTADEIAAIQPVVEAVERFLDLLRSAATDDGSDR